MVEGCSDNLDIVSALTLGGAITFCVGGSVSESVDMPYVMLKKDWPGSFRRTIKTKARGKDVVSHMEFTPNVPVELTPLEIDALRSDIGVALTPVEFDEKARPRVITDDVEADAEAGGEAKSEPPGGV